MEQREVTARGFCVEEPVSAQTAQRARQRGATVMRSLAFALFALSACTHSVHQVALSGFGDLRGGIPVSAEAEQFVVLGFTGNTDFADLAYDRLLQQCPDGVLRNIEARHSTSHGFLSYTNRMKLRAWCVPPTASAVAFR